MLAFLQFYLIQNLRQLNALGIEFDKTINVLTGGQFGQTVSYRTAYGAGWRVDPATGMPRQLGPREPGWCALCWFLGVFVQRRHCMLQFVKGPSNWLTWVRAGICFGGGLLGLFFLGRQLVRFSLARPDLSALIVIALTAGAFIATWAVEKARKELK